MPTRLSAVVLFPTSGDAVQQGTVGQPRNDRSLLNDSAHDHPTAQEVYTTFHPFAHSIGTVNEFSLVEACNQYSFPFGDCSNRGDHKEGELRVCSDGGNGYQDQSDSCCSLLPLLLRIGNG